MNFLWPMAWGFAALMVPVVILYLIRTRLDRRRVSSFLFWDGAVPQVANQSLWRKLRRWLSLLLQLLFLLLLIVALARPMSSGESENAAREVILLDASASMAAHDVPAPDATRWEAARAAARQRIAKMRAFDTALLIEAGESPRVLHGWSRNRRALLRALETAQPAARQADLPAALALAGQLRGEEGRVVLISDGVWKAAPEGIESVEWLRVGTPTPENAGLTLFSGRRSTAAPGEYQLLARVHRKTTGEPVTLELRRNGQLFDVQTLPAEAEWEKSWSGTATGEVRFDAVLRQGGRDDLPVDDAAQVVIPALEPVTVELVSPPHSFLSAVFESLPMVELVHVWPPESLPEAPPSPRVLTLFHQAAPPEGLKRPAMVVLAPGADGFWGRYDGPMESPMVSDFDRESAPLRFVALDQLRLLAAESYTPAAGAVTYAGSFGKPLLFGRWEEGNRWMVLAFGLEGSDLVLRTAFPILMGNLVQSLQTGASDGVTRAGLPGETVTRLASVDTGAGQTVEAAARGGNPWPLWWWAVALGAVWLVVEWGLFSRRITE